MELETGFYASPRWTYEILDCAMPMTFDTYSNCAHQCLYCFSFFQRAIGSSADDYLSHKVRAVNVEKIKRMFTNPDQFAGQFKNYIKRRMVMQWGGLSDGFDWYEKKFGVSLELLRFFKEIDYPISISTKGIWFLDDPRYREVLKDAKNTHWKYSIITTNEEHVKKLEPGVPTALERFEAMRKLNDLGVGATTLRFRPFVLGTSDKCIEDMMAKGEESGSISVTTEFLTWESRASQTSRKRLEVMSEVLGYNVWEFYIENSARASGLLRLNYDLKRPYILEMKEAAERHNLKFFVSDAHHKEDSYHAGCCGLPESGPLSNVNHGQYAHAIKIAKEKGFVRWSDISEEARSLLSDIPVIAAEGFPSDTAERAKRQYQSMFDYMHDIWNNPKSWQSPARYFGGALVPSAPDSEGNVVYFYNKPFIEHSIQVASVDELSQYLRLNGKPNADRFDEVTADGSTYGHVAFPVLVVSKGRSRNATTPKLLDEARLSNWFFIVAPDEVNNYAKAFPNSDVIGMPYEGNSKLNIGELKNEVAKYFANLGYPFIWILDDDLETLEDREGKSVSVRVPMSRMERIATSYSNVCAISIPNVTNGIKEFIINDFGRGFVLYNLGTGVEFRKIPVYEDIAFVLDCSAKGYVSVVYNKHTISATTLPGGNDRYYLSGEQAKNAEILHKEFGNCTYVESASKPFNKKLIVDFSQFQNSIRSISAEELQNE